jgi:hypothetical protein
MTRATAIAAVLVATLLSNRAIAAPQPTVSRCLDASEEGQRLRDAGKLAQSRALFETCAADACPTVVREKCTAWLEETVRAMPSLVFSARDQNGSDVSDAVFEVDGVVRDARTGKPIELDPGPHSLKVSAPGYRSNEQHVIATSGEKARPVRVVLARSSSAGAEPARTNPSTSDGTSPIPTLSYVLGGIGIVSAGASLGLGLATRSDAAALDGAPCATTKTCSEDDVSAIRTRLLVADVLLGVAVVSLVGAGVYWLFSGPSGSK